MSKIGLIERDIEQLDDQSFAALREWFLSYGNSLGRTDREGLKKRKAGFIGSRGVHGTSRG